VLAAALARPATAQQTTATWLGPASGNWTDPTQWSSNPFYPTNGNPAGTTYEADVTATGASYTVTLNSNITVNTLLINSANATIGQTAGTFTGFIDMRNGAYNLSGGTISNSTISSTPNTNTPGRVTKTGSGTATLDNVTVNGTFFVDGGGTLAVQNGLTLGLANMGLWFQNLGGSVDFAGNQTLGGVGIVVFNEGTNSSARIRSVGGTLTIGSGVTVMTGVGNFNTLGDPSSGLVINGAVQSNNGLKGIDINGVNWVNNGVIAESNGGTVNLYGTFTTAGLGNFSSPEGRIQIQGTLDNTGATLTMDATHGSLNLKGGTVIGGTIVSTSANPFYTNPGNIPVGTLNGVTLAGVMDMSIGKVQVQNGLTLSNGTVSLNGSGVGTATLSFPGTQTLGGTGTVSFDGVTAVVQADSGGTLTVGPGVTVQTNSAGGTLGAAGNGLTNQGTVSAQASGRTLSVPGNTVINTGTMQATGGGTLSVTASTAFSNRGLLLAGSGSTVSVSGTLTQEVSSTAETRVVGTLSAGAVSVLAGSLTGTGTVNAQVTNQARVAPGVSGPGVLTVGNYTQTSAGQLAIEIGGTTRGSQYDALVAGAVSVNGTVRVTLISGFTPSAGQTFDVLDWTGAFAGSPSFDFTNAALPNGLTWDTSQFATNGTIGVIPVPEPGLLGSLAGAAGLGLWLRGRRRPG
jgi:hypothetical protein